MVIREHAQAQVQARLHELSTRSAQVDGRIDQTRGHGVIVR
jgi:hypothetical protein